ncbi:MAG: tetratricopeptide repeat protein [Gemmatimonadota bacterium]
MSTLTLDKLRAILPSTDEVQPIFRAIVATSTLGDRDAWASSRILGTAGSRHPEIGVALSELQGITRAEVEHVESVHGLLHTVLEAMAQGDEVGAAQALLDAAALEEARDRQERAGAYASSALHVLVEHPTSRVKMKAQRRRARASRSLGHFDDAFADYAAAFAAAEAIEDPQAAAEAAVGAGNVLEDQAQWNDAQVWYRAALATMDRLDYEGPERWHALLNLHVALRWQGKLDEAATLLDEATAAAERVADPSATAFIENARGQWHMARGEFEAAIDHLTVAIAASQHPKARVIIRVNLSEALLAAGRSLEATEEARRAEQDAITARLGRQLPEVYRVLGRLAAHDGVSDAFVLFEHAIALIEEERAPRIELARTLQMYAESERLLGRTESAGDLETAASQLYNALGIRKRARWADAPAELEKAEDHDQ